MFNKSRLIKINRLFNALKIINKQSSKPITFINIHRKQKFIAILIFATLALLTTLTQVTIPSFQMMAMCVLIPFSSYCYVRQNVKKWYPLYQTVIIICVCGLFGFHFFYFKEMSLVALSTRPSLCLSSSH